MRPNLGQVDEPIDLAKQVIVRDMPLKAEAVEQRLLHYPPFTSTESPAPDRRESAHGASIKRSFSTHLTLSGHCRSRRRKPQLRGKSIMRVSADDPPI